MISSWNRQLDVGEEGTPLFCSSRQRDERCRHAARGVRARRDEALPVDRRSGCSRRRHRSRHHGPARPERRGEDDLHLARARPAHARRRRADRARARPGDLRHRRARPHRVRARAPQPAAGRARRRPRPAPRRAARPSRPRRDPAGQRRALAGRARRGALPADRDDVDGAAPAREARRRDRPRPGARPPRRADGRARPAPARRHARADPAGRQRVRDGHRDLVAPPRGGGADLRHGRDPRRRLGRAGRAPERAPPRRRSG